MVARKHMKKNTQVAQQPERLATKGLVITRKKGKFIKK